MASIEVLDETLLSSPEVKAWLQSEAGSQWAEAERCSSARKAAATKKLDHADPAGYVADMGMVGIGFEGSAENDTLKLVVMVEAHTKSRRGRVSRKRLSGAQRRKLKKSGATGAARRLAKG